MLANYHALDNYNELQIYIMQKQLQIQPHQYQYHLQFKVELFAMYTYYNY